MIDMRHMRNHVNDTVMVLTDIVQIDRIAYDFIGGCGGQLINVDMADYDKIRADAVRLKAVKVEIRNRSELKSLGEEIGSLLEDGISGIIVSVHCARQSKLKVKDMDLIRKAAHLDDDRLSVSLFGLADDDSLPAGSVSVFAVAGYRQ